MKHARARCATAAHLALAAAFVLASSGCRDEHGPPATLVDGSPAASPPIALEGVGAAIGTTLHVRNARDSPRRSLEARCVARVLGGSADDRLAVRRVGTLGESVTVGSASGRTVYGCDRTPGGRAASTRACGEALGRRRSGHLLDPRLDLGCTGADGKPIGFAWIDPGARTRYVAVQVDGYAEVYPVASGLPVRVTTRSVEVAGSRASFDISEHDAHGRALRSYTIEARVAS